MELVSLDAVALRPDGPTLTLSVRSGETVAIMGPAGSGRSALLRVALGRERPGQGRTTCNGDVILAGDGLSKRTRVSSLVKSIRDPEAPERMIAFGLWEVRNETVGELSLGQRAVLSLLEPTLARCPLIGVDGELDRLDPWTFDTVWQTLEDRRRRGAALFIVTDRPEIAARCDTIVVLREQRVRFAGSPDALKRLGPPHRISVATDRQAGVRALVDPFDVTITETNEGLQMEARDGQELAVRLLREGYGDVRFIVQRPPRLEEGLATL